MSIMSDIWIRQMAINNNMIEPFVPSQMRYNNNDKIISYGLSSYGYDVRVARDFKIFTNPGSISIHIGSNANSLRQTSAKAPVPAPNSTTLKLIRPRFLLNPSPLASFVTTSRLYPAKPCSPSSNCCVPE